MFALQDTTLESGLEEPTPDWTVALCRDDEVADAFGMTSLLDLFFSEEIPHIAAAKAICGPCPLKDSCLAGAVERREPWGVWGGQLFQDGKVLEQKRKRGRPPKNPQIARDVA